MNEQAGIKWRNVLIVDDSPENIIILKAALADGDYGIKIALDGEKALEIANTTPIDIILLDVVMPDMDGFEVCRRLKENPRTASIPVIFVTAMNEVADEETGFASGGVDYITKPASASIVRARVATHLALYDQNQELEKKVRERTAEVVETRLEIIQRLARAAEYRDNETGEHIVRMSRYCRIISLASGHSAEYAEMILNAAPLHDIGKIGIPDAILLKPGRLDRDEFEIIKSHCVIGHTIIGDHRSKLLQTASMIALRHHEKWDGKGYPGGISGEDIPISGRIIAVADVFDALTTTRPYKKAWPLEKAVDEIKRESGAHFDPAVVAAFLKSLPEIIEVMHSCKKIQG